MLALGWGGVEWPVMGLCSVLGRVLPVGQRSSGRQQWEQSRGCWEEKKKKIEPNGSLVGPSVL